jgi:hypothetical protein
MPRKRVSEAGRELSEAKPKRQRAPRTKKAGGLPSETASVSEPQPPHLPASEPTHEEIARLAYQFWLERGCEHGHDLEDWKRAEEQLRQRYAASR